MTKVAILWFSGYGHTEKLAQAVAEGVDASGATAQRVSIPDSGELTDADWQTLAAADGIIFGSPTYMAGPAWQMKRVMDASSKLWFVQDWKDKVAGGFTVSATTVGDKGETISAFSHFAMQHGMIWVGAGLLPSNATANGPDDVNWTGGFSGLLAIAPADATPEDAPRKGDLETARLFGRRVAEVAARLAS